MAKFHINKHGVPAPCHAKEGNCPYGGESGSENHFDNLEDAQAAADKVNEEKHSLLPGVEHRKGVEDSNVPSFYHENDDIDDRFYDYIQETGAENFGHATFEHLGRQEQYDIWADGLSKNDYVDAFNDSYTEKDFDRLSPKMAEHLVSEGVYANKEQFDNRVQEVGKEQSFKEFNDYVFNGNKPKLAKPLNDLVMNDTENTQEMIDNLPEEAREEYESLVDDANVEYYIASDRYNTANVDFIYDSNDEYSGEFHPSEHEIRNYFRNVIEAKQGKEDKTNRYYSWTEEAKAEGLDNDEGYMERARELDKNYKEQRVIIDKMAEDVKDFPWTMVGMESQQQGEVAGLRILKEKLF